MTSTAKQVLAWMRRAILNYGFRRFFFGAAVWIALAMVLWAGAHLMAKGDLAHVLLFGIFVGFALFAMRLVDRPRRHEMGETWPRLYAARRLLPQPVSWAGAVIRRALGVGLYAVFLWLHLWLFRVSPQT